MKVILGDGLLGTELHKQTSWNVFSRKKDNLDIKNFVEWSERLLEYDTIINCVAFTQTYSSDKSENWEINVKALDNLIDFCNKHNKKLIHISTDYIYTNSKSNASEEDVPVHLQTWYGYTKLVGDALVQLRSNNYLICRLSHKPSPFPYEEAWSDIKTNCDYVNIISELIVKLIERSASGVFNVGTCEKSIYELALKTNKSVRPTNKPLGVPSDTTMNLTKLNEFLK